MTTFFRKWLRRILLPGLLLVASACRIIIWADHAAEKAGKGRLYEKAALVPDTPVALVFGCAKIFEGRLNLYFKARIEAAAALWKAGKVKCFILTGDNHVHDYNERASYLAKSIGLEVVGLNAESVTGAAALKTDRREKLARVKMWLDVNILRTRPKHLGEKEQLPVATP